MEKQSENNLLVRINETLNNKNFKKEEKADLLINLIKEFKVNPKYSLLLCLDDKKNKNIENYPKDKITKIEDKSQNLKKNPLTSLKNYQPNPRNFNTDRNDSEEKDEKTKINLKINNKKLKIESDVKLKKRDIIILSKNKLTSPFINNSQSNNFTYNRSIKINNNLKLNLSNQLETNINVPFNRPNFQNNYNFLNPTQNNRNVIPKKYY